MTPAFERREQHEDVGDTVALVLVVVAHRPSWLHWFRRARLANKLLGGFIEADQRARRIMRSRVDVQYILHRCHERRVAFGGITQ